jgi:hypothetical protein
MRPDAIRKLLGEQPFAPFCIHVSDGAPYDVAHPEAALVRGMTIYVVLRPSVFAGAIGERIAHISLIHVTRIEVYYPGAAPAP